MRDYIAGALALLGTASLAVLVRLFAQKALEKVIARIFFRAGHWVAKRTTNSVDDESIQILEAQYYGRPDVKFPPTDPS